MLIDYVPDLIGHLVMDQNGAVLSSSGELQNEERIANIFMKIITLSTEIDSEAFSANEKFTSLSITFDDHCYMACFSNGEVHIVKRKFAVLTEKPSIAPVA